MKSTAPSSVALNFDRIRGPGAVRAGRPHLGRGGDNGRHIFSNTNN
jgi:hypothetical protein